MKPASAFRLAAALAFLGVALGAFGAHAFQSRLLALDTVKPWSTASLYHLLHAVVLLFLSREYQARKVSWWAFFFGVLIFSGSLYAYALTGLKALALVTPLGGLALLAGWAALVVSKNEAG